MISHIKNPEHLYTISRWAYSIGEPIMEDVEYDILQKEVRGKDVAEKEDSWSTEECPIALLKTYGLDSLIRAVITTGEKSKSIVSINSVREAELYYEERATREFLLSYKMDGFNTQPHYLEGVRAATLSRGRKTDSVDYSAVDVVLPEKIDVKGHVRIYGETSLTKTAFEKLKARFPSRNYTSRRNAVIGAMVNAPELLSFHAFNFDDGDDFYDTQDKFLILQRWGFNVPPFRTCRGVDVVKTILEMSNSRDYALKSDGIVVTGLNTALVNDMRAVRIYSWARKTYVAKIVSYQESHGRHFIGMKLVIEPTQTADGIQRHIDIDNVARIQKYKLLPGQRVVFEKVSDAVEHINLPLTALLNKGELVYDERV